MNCPGDSEISVYLDGGLEDKAAVEMSDHLVNCRKCSARAKEMIDLGRFRKPEIADAGVEDCPQVELLGRFLDGRLEGEEEHKFLQHLILCEQCRASSIAFKRMAAAETNDLKLPSDNVIRRIKKTNIREIRAARAARSRGQLARYAIPIAAAAAISIIAVIYAVVSSSPQENGNGGNKNGRPENGRPGNGSSAVVKTPADNESGKTPGANVPPPENKDKPPSGTNVQAPAPAPNPEPPEEPGPSEQPDPSEKPPEEVTQPDPKEEPASPKDTSQPVAEPAWETVKLKTMPMRKGEEIHLVSHWVLLTGMLAAGSKLILGSEADVTVRVSPDQLQIDASGDGKFDTVIGKNGGTCWLKLKSAGGEPYNYALAFMKSGKDWAVKSASYAAGMIEGEIVTVADENANGRFSDQGIDSLSVGNTKLRAFLGKVISIDSKLYEFEMDTTGEAARMRPYTGPLGVLDVQSGFSGKARITSAIVSSESCSFNLAAMRKGSPVPAGNYRLVHARLAAAKKLEIDVLGNPESTIRLDDGGLCSMEWGAPLTMDFTSAASGNEMHIYQDHIYFYGKAGEVYFIQNESSVPPPKAQVRAKGLPRILKEITLGTGVTGSGAGRSPVPVEPGAG